MASMAVIVMYDGLVTADVYDDKVALDGFRGF